MVVGKRLRLPFFRIGHIVNRNAGLSVGVLALLAVFTRGASRQARRPRSRRSVGPRRPGEEQREVCTASGTVIRRSCHPLRRPLVGDPPFLRAIPATPVFGPWLKFNVCGSQEPRANSGCTGETGCLGQLRQFFGASDSDRIDCLLATVPDPYHTRLALFTDDAIDGIWKGAGATAWQFSTQWLPWNNTVDSKEGDPAARAKQREEIREQEEQPGVLVFRRAERQEVAALEAARAQAVLLVFIVGETPTAGVNPVQFQIARAYMRALCGPGPRCETVKIVGPTLSGSFDSLAELIVQDRRVQPGKVYQVRSGTATSVRAKEAFDLRAGAAVQVYGATENIRDQKSHFIALLRDLRIPNDRAAILAEGGSAFGRAAAEEGPKGTFAYCGFQGYLTPARLLPASAAAAF